MIASPAASTNRGTVHPNDLSFQKEWRSGNRKQDSGRVTANRKQSGFHGGISPEKFECIGRRRSAWCTKAELSDQADSETPRRLPHADYVLHRTGCAQE